MHLMHKYTYIHEMKKKADGDIYDENNDHDAETFPHVTLQRPHSPGSHLETNAQNSPNVTHCL